MARLRALVASLPTCQPANLPTLPHADRYIASARHAHDALFGWRMESRLRCPRTIRGVVRGYICIYVCVCGRVCARACVLVSAGA